MIPCCSTLVHLIAELAGGSLEHMATISIPTPIFLETVADHPEGLWLAAPKVFPWPSHFSNCPFDGYNWQVCTCPHVIRQLSTVQIDFPALDEAITQAIGLILPEADDQPAIAQQRSE